MKKYNCFAFLNSKTNDKFRSLQGVDCGYANGYVAIPPEHPLYEKTYDAAYEAGIEAHGSLTFSASMPEIFRNFDSECVEWLDGEIPEDYWVFGFDTIHGGDTLAFWNREKCIEETKKLKEQFENWKNEHKRN